MAPYHRALEILDILRLVFEQLYYTRQQRTLAAAACVCQHFKDPALDALWRRLYGLSGPLSLLPLGKSIDHRTIIDGPISASTWAQFDSYTLRVREYITQDHTLLDIHPSVCVKLAQARPCIFPRLRTLKVWFEDDPSTLLEFMACLPPSIRHLYLSGGPPLGGRRRGMADNMSTTFDILTLHRDPQIEHLDVDAIIPVEYVEKFLTFSHLRYLSLSSVLVPSFLARLAILPKLEQLDIPAPMDSTLDPIPASGFPALRHLIIEGRPSTLADVLTALPADRLVHIKVVPEGYRLDASPSPENLHDVLGEWRRCLLAVTRQSTLQNISVRFGDSYDLLGCKSLKMLALVEPLLVLRKLQSLHFYAFMYISLSDDDVFEFAAAWPDLRSFDCYHFPTLDQPSLLALRHFHDLCPKLRKLRIEIDTEKETARSNITGPTHPLHELDLRGSSLSNPESIANHLKALFPHLQHLISNDDDDLASKIIDMIYL